MSKSKLFLLGLFLFLILAAAHRASARADLIRVVVFDTGLNPAPEQIPVCSDMPAYLKGSDVSQHLHGTNIAGLIAQNAEHTKSYCIYPIRIFNQNGQFDIVQYVSGLKFVLERGVHIINLSISGTRYVATEDLMLKKLLARGTVVVAAAGNSALNFNRTGCIVFPACNDPRIIVVGNLSASSNRGKYVDVIENGVEQSAGGVTLTGTSQATAVYTGKLIKRLVEL